MREPSGAARRDEATLRPVSAADADALMALLSLEPVYRYLNDGAPPTRAQLDAWLDAAAATRDPGLGLWRLDAADGALVGCVRLSEGPEGVAWAELTYLLHPARWGRGLATAMSRAALERAFRVVGGVRSMGSGGADVMAGADAPNAASIAVMERLGMRFLRRVAMPAGSGVEYVLRRAELSTAPPGAPRVRIVEARER